MKRGFAGFIASLALGGLVLAGAVNSTGCDDDDDTGAAGAGGGGTGSAGRGGSGGGGGAATTTYNLTLSGSEEVPAVTTSATGTATITIDATGYVTVTGTFSGLTSNATAAHIHGPAPIGMNAAIILALTVPSATSGNVSGTGTLTATQAADLRNGMTYINIHSMTNMSGEIRAQID